MTRKSSLITLAADQTFAWYQHHVQVLHGYALALALRAGLSPAEAATVFVEPWHGSETSLPSHQATPLLLAQQAEQIAEILALTYGEAHVHIEQQGATWQLRVAILDSEPLERYGVSLESHAQWIAEQLRHVCAAKGLFCSVWLEPEPLSLCLSLQIAD